MFSVGSATQGVRGCVSNTTPLRTVKDDLVTPKRPQRGPYPLSRGAGQDVLLYPAFFPTHEPAPKLTSPRSVSTHTHIAIVTAVNKYCVKQRQVLESC